jgi:hypothetical protein
VEDKFFDDALVSGLRGAHYLNDDEYSLEQFNEYEYNDHWKFSFGYIMFGGPAESSIGQFSDNDHFYFVVKFIL